MQEIDIKNIFITLYEKKKFIIPILLLFIFIGIIYSFFIVQPKYKSTCKILIEKADESIAELVKSDDIYINIMTNSNIQNMTIEKFKSDVISIAYVAKIIDIDVKNANKEETYKIANEACNLIISKLEELYNMKNSKIIEQPKLPKNLYNVNHIRDISIATLIGVILSLIYSIFYSAYNEYIKNGEEIENSTDMNVLGTIPLEKYEKKNITSYFIKNLRTNIEFNKNNPRPKSLLITSFMKEDGKSYIAFNLAKSFAETSKKVLLIDADMIEGTQHEFFKVELKKGLTDLLKNINNLDKINIEEYIKKTDIENLSIITLGNRVSNSSELLMSKKFNDLLEKLKEKFDIIIFDSTSSLNISDAVILSSYVDESLIVTQYNKTKLGDLKKLETNIKNVGGKIIGVVINKLPIRNKE